MLMRCRRFHVEYSANTKWCDAQTQYGLQTKYCDGTNDPGICKASASWVDCWKPLPSAAVARYAHTHPDAHTPTPTHTHARTHEHNAHTQHGAHTHTTAYTRAR